jgi:hypothetical protein
MQLTVEESGRSHSNSGRGEVFSFRLAKSPVTSSLFSLSPSLFLGKYVQIMAFGAAVTGRLLSYQVSCKSPAHKPEVLVIRNQDGTHILRSWDTIRIR